MDDPGFLVALRETPETEPFARRFDERDLPKRALWAELDDTPDGLLNLAHEEVRGYELEIAERAGVPEADVVLDVPGEPEMRESSTRVLVNGDARVLHEQSPLVDALRAANRAQWRLGVYAPQDDTEAVGTAAADVLGLDLDGALVSEVRSGLQETLNSFSGEDA